MSRNRGIEYSTAELRKVQEIQFSVMREDEIVSIL